MIRHVNARQLRKCTIPQLACQGLQVTSTSIVLYYMCIDILNPRYQSATLMMPLYFAPRLSVKHRCFSDAHSKQAAGRSRLSLPFRRHKSTRNPSICAHTTLPIGVLATCQGMRTEARPWRFVSDCSLSLAKDDWKQRRARRWGHHCPR